MAVGFTGGDPTKVAKAGDTMAGELVLDDDSPAASEAYVAVHGGADVAADLSAHEADTTSVHGIADTAALETQTGAAAKVTTHAGASDPHGDRAFTTTAIATHTAASDPHGDRAFATSAISTHAGAADPHGDRAYAAGQASAALATAEAYTDTAVSGLASDTAVVHKASTETITGAKTFSLAPGVPDASFATVKVAGLDAALAATQPLDSDLTAIAGLTPTDGDVIVRVSGGWLNRTITQLKTALGLVKADVGLSNVDNTADASKPVSTAQAAADALNLKISSDLGDLHDAATARTNLGLGTAATTASSAYDVAGAAAAAQAASQPLDADLTTIAGLTATTDNVIQSVAGSWASRTMAQLKTALALVKGDVGLGNVDNTADASKAFAGSQIASGTVAYARLPVGAIANTVAAGDDSRMSDTRTPTDNTVTSAKIVDGAIVDADINGSAAIALSKLATNPLARANHTGTQTASTVSDFDTQVRTSTLNQMTAPTADLSINTHKLTNVTDPSSAQDAATKNYVDSSGYGTWTDIASLGTNTGHGTPHAQSRTAPGGKTELRGQLAFSGAISANATIATVPAGQLPYGAVTYGVRWAGTGSANTFLNIDTSGHLSVSTASLVNGNTLNLDGIWFPHA